MIINSPESLPEIFPKIEVGPSGGILPPRATLSRELPFTFDMDMGTIKWDVPMDFFPYLRQVAPLESPAVRLQVDAVYNDMSTFRDRAAAHLQNTCPAYAQQRGFFSPDIGELPMVLQDAVWDQYVDPTGVRFFSMTRSLAAGLAFVQLPDASLYFKGNVPLISDYGEKIRRSTTWFDKYKNKPFNLPAELLVRRKKAITTLRILMELAKTPISISMTMKRDAVIPAGQNSWFMAVESTQTGHIAFPAAGPSPLEVPYPAVANPEFTQNFMLACQNDVAQWPFPAADAKVVAPYILGPRDAAPLPVADRQAYLQTIHTMGIKSYLVETICMAVGMLAARNVPRFKIPEHLGGGEKYVAIISSTMADSITPSRFNKEDVCIFAVPAEFLLYALYPNGTHPLLPPLQAIVCGAPGLFNFVPKGAGSEDMLLEQTKDFERMHWMGWEDRSTYSSARAPMGHILSQSNVWPHSILTDAFFGAQDTIRIMSEVVIGGAGLRAVGPEEEEDLQEEVPMAVSKKKGRPTRGDK